MRRTSILFGSVAAVLFAASSEAQPPGITPEMSATSRPRGGARRAEPGRYDVASEPASGAPGRVTFRPADLGAFPARDSLPVVAWGNGGCAINTGRYAGFLETIASHGFLVLGTAPVEG